MNVIRALLLSVFVAVVLASSATPLQCGWPTDNFAARSSSSSVNVTCAPLSKADAIILDTHEVWIDTSMPAAPSATVHYVDVATTLYIKPYVQVPSASRKSTRAVIATVNDDTQDDTLAAALGRADKRIAAAVAAGADLIVFPELYFPVCDDLARFDANCSAHIQLVRNYCATQSERYAMWLVCSLVTVQEGPERHFFNTALVYNRTGDLVSSFYKMFPVIEPEYGIGPEAYFTPSLSGAVAFDTDFGMRVSIAICNDDAFPEVWLQMAALGVDLVLWPAAWRGGAIINNYAYMHNYYIVNSPSDTRSGVVADPAGRSIDEQSQSDNIVYKDNNTFVVSLETELVVIHDNFNTRMWQMINESYGAIEVDLFDGEAQRYVLRPAANATTGAVFLRHILQQYGVYTNRHLSHWMRQHTNQLRSTGQPIPPSPTNRRKRGSEDGVPLKYRRKS